MEALFLDHMQEGDPRAAADYRLEAERLLVEEEHAAASAVIAKVRFNIMNPTRVVHDGPGTLVGIENEPGHRFWVLPIPGKQPPRIVLEHDDCAGMVTPHRHLDARRVTLGTQPVIDVKDGLRVEWTDCKGGTRAIVSGDFKMILWGWTSQLQGAQGNSTTLHSGHEDAVDGTPADGTVGEAREHYVTVSNGTMTIPLEEGTYLALLREVLLEAPLLALHHMTGTVPYAGAVTNAEVMVEGATALRTSPVDGSLAASLHGEPTRVIVNGVSYFPQATTPMLPVPEAELWLVLVLLTAVLLSVAAPAKVLCARAVGRSSASPKAPPKEQRPTSRPRRALATVRYDSDDPKARQTVLRIISRCPGLSVRDVLARSGMRKTRAHDALNVLLERGAVEKRGSDARWYLFVSSPDLDGTWRRMAALAHDDLRLLYGLLQEHPGAEQRRIVAACRERWDWSPSTTKGRLRRLAAMGLAEATERVPRGTPAVTWVPTAA